MGNREIIQGMYDGFATGDIGSVLGALDDKVEWTEAEGFPLAGTYIGPQAVLEGVFMRLGTEYDGFSAVPDRIVVDGDMAVSVGTYSGAYKATGKSFRARFAHSFVLSGGKVTGFEQIVDSAKVNEALQ